jgi:hypothetical protein
MVRVVIGAFVATIAMFAIGFILFASGLQRIASSGLEDNQAAAVRQVLSENLPRTATYFVPDPEGSAAQTVMFGQGPIATIHYNTGGYAAEDTTMLLTGFIFTFVTALLFGLALLGISKRVSDFGSRARVGIIFAVATSAYIHLGEPLYYHHDWPHFVYAFVANSAMLATGALIVAWFLPKASAAAPADAPAEV